MTTIFEDLGSGTRVTFRMLHDTEAECEKVKPFAVDANEQNFDRLEALLAKLTKYLEPTNPNTIGKIVQFMHVSLDGFVAGPNGEMDWIKVDDEIFDFAAKSSHY